MNPQTPPTPEQQPKVPMAEIPAAPAVTPTAAQPAPVSAPPIATPIPTDGTAPVVPAPAAPAADANPAIAADVDVIEKEWVDKASDVIAKTAGDPHAEEEAIEDLQVDYMKKRYGKDVAKSGD